MNGEEKKQSSEETVKKFQEHQALYNTRFTERHPVAFVSSAVRPGEEWPWYDAASLETLEKAVAERRARIVRFAAPEGTMAEGAMVWDVYVLADESMAAAARLSDEVHAELNLLITGIRKPEVLEVKPLTKPAPPTGFEYPSTEAIAKAAYAHSEYEKEKAANVARMAAARRKITSANKVVTFTVAEYAMLEEMIALRTLSPVQGSVVLNILAMGMERGDQTA